MKPLFKIICSVIISAAMAPAHAVLTTYDNMADLFTQSGLKTTYDFETLSGFPAGDFTYVGMFDNVLFDATVYSAMTPVSGTQAMTGNPDTFATANLDMSGVPGNVLGFGFFGLDLTVDEVIRVRVDFANAGTQSFDVLLGGATAFTPIYFGLYDADDRIDGIELFGTDSGNAQRAWLLDDLTLVTTSPVPLPPATWLFGSGLLALLGWARRTQNRG